MIRELLIYLTTRCPAPVRQMGYLYESIAMRERYLRNSSSWASHLESTKRFIAQATHECPDRGRITVLGAGLLLDLPLEILAETFRDVVLADILFLPEVRRRVGSYANIRLIEHDLTGVVERLYRAVKDGRNDLPEALPSLPEAVEGSGLVVSLNLLSQLSVIPKRFVVKHMSGIPDEMMGAWCRNLILGHYLTLKALPIKTCIISDYSYVHRDKDGLIREQGSTLQ
ncbi:hypothetical protein EG833_02900, partial [archaeon]|nr:hypothetical protein [archaeon]